VKGRRKAAIGGDYVRQLRIRAPRARVFDAIATLDGLRGWWTPRVTGSDQEGGVIRLAFEGLDEHIDLQVLVTRPPVEVEWSIVRHTSIEEWNGTSLRFELSALTDGICVVAFCHRGLTPKLACYEDCALGWKHFLASLVALAEQGRGRPFG
jgi:uncharacterized protein YndB with AHSA1/START domain